MITLCKIGGVFHSKVLELCGLSTDEKPLVSVEGVPLINASTFLEMDTKKIFIYSQENKTWYEMVD